MHDRDAFFFEKRRHEILIRLDHRALRRRFTDRTRA